MGHSAGKVTGENARYGSVDAVREDTPQRVAKM
jgi:hypothetical protein